jgi:hypothetical protein
VISIERTVNHRDRLLRTNHPSRRVTPPNRRHFHAKQSSHSDLCRDSLIFGTEGRGSESMGMEKIRHLVVLMLENRSFDNMVGYVYADKANHPPINIPAPAEGSRTTCDGLSKPAPDDDFWNPGNANFFEDPPADPQKIQATEAGDGLQNADSRSG